MDARQRATRQALMDSATVLLAENPGASFVEVAEAAGIGRATLYRHFPSRDDLLRALSLEAIQATDDATAHVMTAATSSLDALRLTIEAIVPMGDRYYFLIRQPSISDEQVIGQLNRQNNELKMLIQASQQELGIDRDIPADWVVLAFNNLIYAAWQMIGEQQVAAADAATWVYRTLIHGLAPQAQPQTQAQT